MTITKTNKKSTSLFYRIFGKKEEIEIKADQQKSTTKETKTEPKKRKRKIPQKFDENGILKDSPTQRLRELIKPGDQVFIFNVENKELINTCWNCLKYTQDKNKYKAKITKEKFICATANNEKKVVGYLVTRL